MADKCKECGKELHFYNKAIGKYKGLCSGCAMKENIVELKKNLKEASKEKVKKESKQTKIEGNKKTEICKNCGKEIGFWKGRVKSPNKDICMDCWNKKQKEEKKEREEFPYGRLERKNYPEEINSTLKNNFGNTQIVVGYLGGHPELSKPIDGGELILTKKKLIFKGIDIKDNKRFYTKEDIEIPLKSIVDIEFKPKQEKTGDVATGIVKEDLFGVWSVFLKEHTKPVLMVSIKSKGMKIGIGFDFSGLLIDSNEIGNRWKNEIIKYRHKA